MSPFQLALVGVMAASLAACASVTYTPYLPTVQWQVPPPIPAAEPIPPQPAQPAEPVEPVG